MSAGYQRDVLKKLLLAVWGVLTLVLFFCVVLLVNEMIKSGGDPVGVFRPNPENTSATSTVPKPEQALGNMEVVLYFATSEGSALAPEVRTIEYTDSTVENCRRALEALIAGPRDMLTPILPSTAKVRALYLQENGELVVDLSRELLTEHARFKSASLEALMVYGIVNSLTQKKLQPNAGNPVTKVRFLLEGLKPLESFPAHIDLSEPIGPDQRWIAPDAEPSGHA